jgi:hypothetical protein
MADFSNLSLIPLSTSRTNVSSFSRLTDHEKIENDDD